jgi:hypothetical protein
MFKRIYSYTAIVAASLAVLVSCKDDDDRIEKYTSNVDVSKSEILLDNEYDAPEDVKYDMDLVFSLDNGVTFTDWPVLSPGQSYKVKVVQRQTDGTPGSFKYDASGHRLTEREVILTHCFSVDWSASKPEPISVDANGVAEFRAGTSNALKAIVVDDYTAPFDGARWSGVAHSLEDYGGGSTYGPYDNNITQDPADPNVFYLDNFYDQGLVAKMQFDPASGTVKFPDQTLGGKPLTNSSGTFVQCKGEAVINLNYDGGDWVYHITME